MTAMPSTYRMVPSSSGMSGFDLSTPTSSRTAYGPKPDRAARWVFIRIFTTETAANARRFLRDLERAAPPLSRDHAQANGRSDVSAHNTRVDGVHDAFRLGCDL